MRIQIGVILMTFMGIITSCLGQKEEQHIYLAGWEAEFNGDEQCQKFLQTQVIDKETASTISSSIDLVFKNGKLVKAFDNEWGFKNERILKESEIGMPFQELVPNQIFNFHKAAKSESYLGGEIPEELSIPKFNFNSPFQYLGKVSKSDEAFNWLPFDLHLVAPIYLNIDKLFVDYSDPLNPKVLNIEELEQTDSSYEGLKPDSEVVFEQVFITAEKSNNFGGLGHTGVADWIQYPEIPTCPKSKKTMKFLFQLTYDGIDIKTKRSNVNPEMGYEKQYFEKMNFWGSGDLYVFFEPESKVACFFIQNT